MIEIPLRDDLPAYNFSTDIDGVSYLLGIRFNTRTGRWYLDVSAADGTELCMGEELITGLPLFRGKAARVKGFPQGTFLLIDSTGAGRDPGETGIGSDFRLIYQAP